MMLMVAKAEADPKSICSLSIKEFMEVYLSTWTEAELHRKASRFGIENMLTGDFYGAQDKLADPRLLELWKSWGMDGLRASAIADVDAEYHAGRLPWAFETQDKLLKLFPRRGKLDTYKDCQADEGEDAGVDVPHDEDEFGKDFFVEPAGIVLAPEVECFTNSSAEAEIQACSALVEQDVHDPVAVAAQEERTQQLHVFDKLVEDSAGLKCRKTTGLIGRKRANVLKTIRRAEEGDGTIDTIAFRALSEDKARRKAEDLKRQQMDAQIAAISDATEKLAARQALQHERLREAADVARKAHHLKAVDDAAIKLQPTTLCSQSVGQAKAKQNRREAVYRLLALAGEAVGPDLLKNFEFDFPKWDSMMSHRHSQGTDHSTIVFGMLRQQLRHLQANTPAHVSSWWKYQTSCVLSAVVLPALKDPC